MVFILNVWLELDPILPYIFFFKLKITFRKQKIPVFSQISVRELGQRCNLCFESFKTLDSVTTEKVNLREMSVAELLTVTK